MKCREHRGCHVGNMDEVAALAAVLEDLRRLATQQAVDQDRRYSGVWSVSRHSGAIDVVEAEGGYGSSGLPAPDCRQLLAVCLRCRIGIARIQRGRLRHQFGMQVSAAHRAQRVEAPSV